MQITIFINKDNNNNKFNLNNKSKVFKHELKNNINILFNYYNN